MKVGWIVREPGPPAHFSLYDEDAQPARALQARCCSRSATARSASPGVYGEARENPETADRVVQAYEPKQYHEGGRYLVVGSGIAAVNEWANCVEAGAQCIALRRNPHPDEQDLNVPRCLFDGCGIDAFQGLSFDQRVDFLGAGAPRHRAAAAQLGREGQAGDGGGPLRGGDRQRHRDPARARPA